VDCEACGRVWTGPHCPYEGLKLYAPQLHDARRAESSLPLRGIETGVGDQLPDGGHCPHCPYEGLKRVQRASSRVVRRCPHCPYEGLKQVDAEPGVVVLTTSSLPLRGIETGGATPAPPRRSPRVLIAPTRD